MNVIVAEVRQQRNLQQPTEGVLEEQVKEYASEHDAYHVAQAELEHFVELDKEAVRKL